MRTRFLGHKHTHPLFDALHCLRAYPEFREHVVIDFTQREWLQQYNYIKRELLTIYNQTYPFEERLRRAFLRKYPNTPCIDPSFDATHYAQANELSFSTFEEAYTHWLTVGKKQGLEHAPGKTTVLSVILKTYNERFLIDEWLTYYDKLIGLENVIILDHSSTDSHVLQAYKRYPNLCVITIPRSIEHDVLHNTKHFRTLFDMVKQHSLFFTMLDTDEFLCRFDGTSITTNGITERLQTLRNEEALGTVWLTNYFNGTEATKPREVTSFNINDQPLRHSIMTSKNIFRHDTTKKIIGHNRTVPDIGIVPDLLLLHVKRANFAARIDAQRHACVSFGIINEHDTKEAIIQKIELIEPTERRHCAKEVLGYLTNPEAYVQGMIDEQATHQLTTNIIAATVGEAKSVYTYTHPTEKNIDALLREHFLVVAPNLETGAHLVPPLTSTGPQTNHHAA